MVRVAGPIDDSLYLAAERVELPQDVTASDQGLQLGVDFQRDLRPGDAFETTFEEVSLQDGSDQVRGGDLLYGALTLSGRQLEAYRFQMRDGAVEMLRPDRQEPAQVPAAHPGRRRPHLVALRHARQSDPGLQHDAPRRRLRGAVGTPIYAAGNGPIVEEGRKGGYGNYIRIRHNGDYSTAYGHMSRFAKGMSPGRRVQQGDVIGYIGTTGRATGPHLHYEVLRDDSQINPMSVKQPPNTQLAGADLQRFQSEVARIDQLRIKLAHDTRSRAGSRITPPTEFRPRARRRLSSRGRRRRHRRTRSPSLIRPSRIRRASGSCSSRWITRFSGRAP